MIDLLKELDTRLFFFFNKSHTPFMDSLMGIMGNRFVWIPLYAVILFFAWRKKKARVWLVLVSVAALIALSDQVSVHLFKNTFERYRPCHNLEIKEQVKLINGHCGGLYGFVSSHAANSFALITFLSLFFRHAGFALCAYIWAGMIGYSRVYAGVHYPFDIIGGMFLGMFLAIVVYKFYSHYERRMAG